MLSPASLSQIAHDTSRTTDEREALSDIEDALVDLLERIEGLGRADAVAEAHDRASNWLGQIRKSIAELEF